MLQATSPFITENHVCAYTCSLSQTHPHHILNMYPVQVTNGIGHVIGGSLTVKKVYSENSSIQINSFGSFWAQAEGKNDHDSTVVASEFRTYTHSECIRPRGLAPIYIIWDNQNRSAALQVDRYISVRISIATKSAPMHGVCQPNTEWKITKTNKLISAVEGAEMPTCTRNVHKCCPVAFCVWKRALTTAMLLRIVTVSWQKGKQNNTLLKSVHHFIIPHFSMLHCILPVVYLDQYFCYVQLPSSLSSLHLLPFSPIRPSRVLPR